jgi:hypothetical protein
VQDVQQKVIALWAGVFQARSREDQLKEIPTDAKGLLERDSRCRVHVEYTPGGVPVVLSKRGARILTRKKLREFQAEHQCFCQPVPRNVLESLSRSEYGQTWLQLQPKEKLYLLDFAAAFCAQRGRRP